MHRDEHAPADLLRVTAADADYRRQAAAEVAYWQNVHPLSLEALEGQYDDGPTVGYFNLRFTGDPRTDWVATIARRGTFRRALILGISSPRRETRLLETNPSLAAVLVDVSDRAVERRCGQLGERFPGRVTAAVADLNFLELPADHYDLVVSSSTIHHVTNLEHLAFQINRTLTPDGRFFLEDYVGEPRFQFGAAKRRLYEEIYRRDLGRQVGRKPGLTWLDASDLSPFCGVRSDETLGVFRRYLDELEVLTAGALIVPMTRTRPVDFDEIWARAPRWRIAWSIIRDKVAPRRKAIAIDPTLFEQLSVVGDTASDAGLIPPGIAFAVYRKRC